MEKHDMHFIDPDKVFEGKIVTYPSILTFVLGAQKNPFIETVLLRTHNILFGWEFLIKHSYLEAFIWCQFVCLIWFFTSQSVIFQLHRDESSWVEPFLS